MAGGKRPGAGRPKGSPNKVTTSMKEAFREAFDELGGSPALAKWAKANPTEFYKLSSKLIPIQLQGELQGALKIIHESK